LSSFLYHVTGFDGATPSAYWLESRGLLDVLGRGHSCLPLTDGSALLAAGSVPTRLLRLEPANQNWAAWGDGVEFGFWTDERRPTEHGLRRAPEQMLFEWPSKHILLGNGELWAVPVLRDASAQILLPATMRWNAGEGWTPVLSARHARIKELLDAQVSVALHDAGIVTDGAHEISAAEQCEMIREALALVYRVGPQEIGALGLLVGSNIADCAAAVVNMEEAAGWIGEYLRRAVERMNTLAELAVML